MITLNKTKHGSLRGEFRDHSDETCFIMEGSRQREPTVWFGIQTHRGEDHSYMRLDHQNVADLVPLLLRFLETGSIDNANSDILTVEDTVQFFKAVQQLRKPT